MSKLDEWAALAEKATPGPWDNAEAFDASFVCAGDPERFVSETWVARLDNRPGRTRDKRDAAFIAASRTVVPTLIEALQAIETLCQVADYNDGLISTEYIRSVRDAALGETND